MEWRKGTLLVSDEPGLLDLEFIIGSLHQTYWAKERPAEVIRESLVRSLCFGVYEGKRQIGFARVITDQATSSYLCDVIIDPCCRGQGIGTWLMECVLAHPKIIGTTKVLATQDAKTFYEKFGFERREFMMKRKG